jgi:hypothetical protein
LVYRDEKDSRLTALGRDIRSEFDAIASVSSGFGGYPSIGFAAAASL